MDTPSDESDGGEERSTRRMRTLEEKLAIVREVMRPGTSVAAVARKHDMNANLLFAWRRLHQRGLLEGQRHAKPVPLLPVKVTTPTVTPTRRTRTRRAPTLRKPTAAATGSCIEVLLAGHVCLRLYGEAERAVMARVLEWLTPR